MATSEFIPRRTGLSQTPLQIAEPVIDHAGQRGTIRELLQSTDAQLAQVLIETEEGAELLLPVTILQRDENDILRLPLRFDQVVMRTTAGEGAEEVRIVLPIIEETLDIDKSEQVTGRVRVAKSVSEHEALVHEALAREEVAVERVPIKRIVETPAKQRHEDGTLIIPIHKEVLVVEKQLMLVEELHISKEQKVEQVQQTVTLRTEEATVERVEEARYDDAEYDDAE